METSLKTRTRKHLLGVKTACSDKDWGKHDWFYKIWIKHNNLWTDLRWTKTAKLYLRFVVHTITKTFVASRQPNCFVSHRQDRY